MPTTQLPEPYGKRPIQLAEAIGPHLESDSFNFRKTLRGISFAFSGIDQQAMPGEALERELALMRACWAFFDGVLSRVSAEMQRGPRGGGRDRDHIVRHTFRTE